MFDKIENKLKAIAYVEFVLSIIIAVFWMVTLKVLIAPISFALVGIASAMFIYGFAEIIEYIKYINSYLSKWDKKLNKDNLKESFDDLPEL